MKTYIFTSIVLTFLINITAVSQVLTDDVLYAKAYTEIQNKNWPVASAYLFAYIQRNPIAFIKDKNYESKVNYAFTASINNIESEKNRLLNEITKQSEYIAKMQYQYHIPVSSTYEPIILADPPLLDQPEQPPIQPPSKTKKLKKLLEGPWQATLTSSSDSVFTGTLTIVTNADIITGAFTLSDSTASKVTGIFDGENLVLLRNTGATTIQSYAMKYIDENHYSGTYKNEGRVPDDGSIDLVR
jgi:hypothetical protein